MICLSEHPLLNVSGVLFFALHLTDKPGFRLQKGVFIEELDERVITAAGGRIAVGDRLVEVCPERLS